MADLSSTTGIVALAGGGLGLTSLATGVAAHLRMRRLKLDQRRVLGEHGETDLIAHAASLDGEFRALHSYVEDVAARLDTRLGTAEGRIDGAIAYSGLVRYDAYNEMSGRQSTSIALLDSTRSGIVISSIHHRDQARMYAKQVRDGRGELELSPEEHEAIRIALDGESEGSR